MINKCAIIVIGNIWNYLYRISLVMWHLFWVALLPLSILIHMICRNLSLIPAISVYQISLYIPHNETLLACTKTFKKVWVLILEVHWLPRAIDAGIPKYFTYLDRHYPQLPKPFLTQMIHWVKRFDPAKAFKLADAEVK